MNKIECFYLTPAGATVGPGCTHATRPCNVCCSGCSIWRHCAEEHRCGLVSIAIMAGGQVHPAGLAVRSLTEAEAALRATLDRDARYPVPDAPLPPPAGGGGA